MHEDKIRSKIKNYFEHNLHSVDDQSIIWHAHKAFLQGLFITLGAQEKKNHSVTTENSLKQICDLD